MKTQYASVQLVEWPPPRMWLQWPHYTRGCRRSLPKTGSLLQPFSLTPFEVGSMRKWRTNSACGSPGTHTRTGETEDRCEDRQDTAGYSRTGWQDTLGHWQDTGRHTNDRTGWQDTQDTDRTQQDRTLTGHSRTGHWQDTAGQDTDRTQQDRTLTGHG